MEGVGTVVNRALASFHEGLNLLLRSIRIDQRMDKGMNEWLIEEQRDIFLWIFPQLQQTEDKFRNIKHKSNREPIEGQFS